MYSHVQCMHIVTMLTCMHCIYYDSGIDDVDVSGQLACARACESEVNDGALYLSLCMLSVSVTQAGV